MIQYTIRCRECPEFFKSGLSPDDTAVEIENHRREKHPDVTISSDPVYCEQEIANA